MEFKYILASLAAVAALGASAQGLHQEIDVEREIVPIERDATRINTLPTLVLPPITPARLSFSERVVTARVPNSASPLDPTAYGDTLTPSPWRGYAALGIFPLYNVDFSAGYRILDTSRSRLCLWTQYDGRVYSKDRGENYDTSYWRDHTVSAGLDYDQKIGRKSFLDASLNYTFSSHTIAPLDIPHYQLEADRVNFNAAYRSRAEGLTYRIAARYSYFGYCKQDMEWTPAKQNLFGLDLGGKIKAGETSWVKLDADIAVLSTSKHTNCMEPTAIDGGESSGLLTLSPAYLYAGKNFDARLGARLNVSFNDGNVFHVAPDVLLGWHPSSYFALSLSATGGVVMNTLASVNDITPYCDPFSVYGSSHVPYDFNGTITIGPFRGGYLQFFGGYARANNWLMPFSTTTPFNGGLMFSGVDINGWKPAPSIGLLYDESLFNGVDMKGWHVGVAVGYDYRDLFSISLRYETAAHDNRAVDKGYYLWRDRARHVFSGELTVRPVSQFEITAGMEWRCGRNMIDYKITDMPVGNSPSLLLWPVDLGNVSNLTLGASYAFTPSLTFFLRGENLLNHRHIILGDRISQGITGLIGASYKF